MSMKKHSVKSVQVNISLIIFLSGIVQNKETLTCAKGRVIAVSASGSGACRGRASSVLLNTKISQTDLPQCLERLENASQSFSSTDS
jgi:hypothetical protein